MADDNSLLAIVLPLSLIAVLIALLALIPILCRRYCFKCYNDIFCYECCRGTGFCVDCCHDMGCDCPCGPVVEDYPAPGKYPPGYRMVTPHEIHQQHSRQSSNPPNYDPHPPPGHSAYTPVIEQPPNITHGINAFSSTAPTVASSATALKNRAASETNSATPPSEPRPNTQRAIGSTYETPRSHARYDTPPHDSFTSSDLPTLNVEPKSGRSVPVLERQDAIGHPSSSQTPTPPPPDYHRSDPVAPPRTQGGRTHETTPSAWASSIPSGWSYQPIDNAPAPTTSYLPSTVSAGYSGGYNETVRIGAMTSYTGPYTTTQTTRITHQQERKVLALRTTAMEIE